MKIGTEEIALGVSGLSLLLSGLAIAWDRRTARKLERLQLAQAEREAQDLQVCAISLELDTRGSVAQSWGTYVRLWVTNDGPAVAREVVIAPVVRRAGAGSPIHPEDALKLPLELAKGQRFPIRVMIGPGYSRPFDVELSWTDGTGQHSRTDRLG